MPCLKLTVQTGGRISIPEAERQALGIEEGDLVQVIIIPLSRKKKSNSNSTTTNSVSTNNTNTFKG